jgi:hypothetical protein
VLACGSDDLEISCACDRHEPLADRMDQAPVSANEPRDGHALDEGSSFDSGFEDVGDARVDPTEQCLEAAEHPRFDNGLRAQRLQSADGVRGLARGGLAVAEPPSDVAQLALDA